MHLYLFKQSWTWYQQEAPQGIGKGEIRSHYKTTQKSAQVENLH